MRVAKIHSQSSISFNLVTLGTVASPYKGQRYVISAIPEMIKRGIPVKYYIVGGGNQRTLQTLVKRLGVEEYVTFVVILSIKIFLVCWIKWMYMFNQV